MYKKSDNFLWLFYRLYEIESQAWKYGFLPKIDRN